MTRTECAAVNAQDDSIVMANLPGTLFEIAPRLFDGPGLICLFTIHTRRASNSLRRLKRAGLVRWNGKEWERVP